MILQFFSMIVIFTLQFWILEVIFANQAILFRVNTYFLFAWLQCSVDFLGIFNLANPIHPSLALIYSLWKEKKLGTEYTHWMCAYRDTQSYSILCWHCRQSAVSLSLVVCSMKLTLLPLYSTVLSIINYDKCKLLQSPEAEVLDEIQKKKS